ncbi:alpha/beta hydrolase [Mycobacterium sp. URHB0021]
MVNRFLVWLGAGVVAAGMTAAVATGAAAADTGSESGAGGATSSASTKSIDDKPDSEKNGFAGDGSSVKRHGPVAKTDEGAGAADDAKDVKHPDADKPDAMDPTDTVATDEDTDVTEPITAEPIVKDDPPVQESKPSGDDSDGPVAGLTAEHYAKDNGSAGSGTAKPITTEVVEKPAATDSGDNAEEAAVVDVVDDVDDVDDVDGGDYRDPVIAPEKTPDESTPAVADPLATVVDTPGADEDHATFSARSATFAMSAVQSAPEITAMAVAPPPPSLINVIGTLIFTIYNVALRLFEGPPVLPPGSTVTVRSSTLTLGPGKVVPADWYFPADPDPTRLIYLQHGFLASGRFYSYTAATLAQETHSVVVAPSVTSNFFAIDGFWIGGAPLQGAVADLFNGDRTALTDSASTAIGRSVDLPQRVVIAGHSAGGGLALAVAGYMAEDGTIDDLAGLVLLDGVALGDVTSTVSENIPDSLPIYQISSPPYAWNMFGATSAALVKARQGEFNGVELVGGSHIDAMQGGNPLIQFGAYLIAGFSKPQNIEAVKILAVGWINDMFAGTDEGVDGDPGEVIPIPTIAGPATAVALPASESGLSPLDQVLQSLFLVGSQFFFTLGSSTPQSVESKELMAA